MSLRFSQEDLVSNLVGFYRALYHKVDIVALCKPISQEASENVWRSTGAVSSRKNPTFEPILHNCKECPAKPKFLSKGEEVEQSPRKSVLLTARRP